MRFAIHGLLALSMLVVSACGDDATATSSGSTGSSSTTGGGCEPDCPTASAFDACGGKIVGSDGAIDGDEYVAQANAWSLDIVNCRLGPDYAAYHGSNAPDDRPTAYQPETQQSPEGRNGQGIAYQLGGPGTQDPGNYGSVVAQVGYVPEVPENPGLDRISIYDWSNHVIVEAPEKVWWGTPDCWWPNCHSNPDPSTQLDTWASALGHAVAEPTTLARTRMSWDNDALVIFRGGLIGATGSQTSDDHFPYFAFPPNKVPTAIAITSYNELALVTIWDTDAKKGQVAVLALEGKGLGPNTHGWFYIGFPSVGSFTNIKLLGYIDLPDMATPTAIDAAGSNGSGLQVGGILLGQHTLDSQSDRDDWHSGMYATEISTAGYAVVASRWEGKVTFIDLQPLYAYLRDMYTTTQAKFDETKAQGPAGDQWPYTFDVEPSQVPTVTKTIAIDHPTAVLAGRHRYDDLAKAHVASLDGTITTFDVSSLGNEDTASPDDIQVLATVKAGQNPVAMTWPRNTDPKDDAASPYDYRDSFIVVSRGDRAIDFVTTSGATSTIFRHFTDSRMGDPVDIDVGERAYVMAVADFGGKKVLTYRFAPTPADHISPPQAFGLGADGTADSECGGELPIEGHAFKVSSTNVN